MKKLFSIILATVTVMSIYISAGITASAATSAFAGEIKTSPSTECHDAGGEKTMGWAEDPVKGECYGIGNTEPGDYVVFRSIDFGTTGASEATIRFSFLITDYSPLPCTMEMYIDSLSGKPVATFNIENTGHWIEEASMNFSSKCNIPPGVHDVYVKWKDNTGSLFGISFKKASGGNVATTSGRKTPDSSTTTTPKNTGGNTTSQTVPDETKDDTTTIDSDVTSPLNITTVTDETMPSQTETVTAPKKKSLMPVIIMIVIAAILLASGVVGIIFAKKKSST